MDFYIRPMHFAASKGESERWLTGSLFPKIESEVSCSVCDREKVKKRNTELMRNVGVHRLWKPHTQSHTHTC